MDYDNPEVEEQWCAERRNDVSAYLQRQGVQHGQVGEWAAWHLAPYVAIWAIESKVAPGHVGWWAISGDLPTDYVSASAIKHPREAMAAIAARWRDIAENQRSGQIMPGISMGNPTNWKDLAPLLAARAALLQDWATEPGLWEGL
ncbi:DUF4826 family protein [Dyella mobilis]|uniref:DUF4826 family protein n=1 Tax=Dyella mobilis TaxID=1849582 RepID=A0ABS2KER2_9GAMM|nr:DUF4826 family protein [Dyella mobilis]MBM7129545.1 DUF4826 family protein [Dyella mobilis]GLQ98191.1 hypothetical protein GCM10007863_26110 [Dyella mobilis]